MTIEIVDYADEESDEATPQGFVVDSIEKAEWAMAKKARALTEIAEREEYAKARKAHIDERTAAITAPLHRTCETMDALLLPWIERRIAEDGKRKSVPLINGVAGFRQAPEHLEVMDAVTAVAHLEEMGHAECIRVKKEVDKTATRKLIEDTGLYVEGTAIVPGERKFYAEPIPMEATEKKATA
jgi:phage host-nuclease inhibitor protein Gam